MQLKRTCKVLSVILCLLSLPLTTGCLSLNPDKAAHNHHQRRADALTWFSLGVQAEIAEDYPKAINAFQKALQASDQYEKLYYRITKLALLNNQDELALQTMASYADAFPSSADARLGLAYTHRALGQDEQAKDIYRTLIRKPFISEHALYELASMQAAEGQLAEAVNLIEQHLNTIQNAKVYQLLGRIQALRIKSVDEDKQISQLKKAAAAFHEALRLDPDNADIMNTLAKFYMQLQNYTEAIPIYRALAKIEPAGERPLRELALAYAADGNQAEALSTLRELSGTDSAFSAYSALGDLYQALDNQRAAIQAYEQAADNQTASPSTYIKLSLMLEEEQQTNAAVAILNRGLTQHPDHLQLMEFSAYTMLHAKMYTQALDRIDATIQLTTNHTNEMGQLIFYKAVTEQLLGRISETATSLVKAVDIHPRFLNMYYQSALADRQLTLEDSIEVLEKVKQQAANGVRAAVYQGLLHHANQHFEQAVTYFDEFMEQAEESGAAEKMRPSFFFIYGSAAERAGLYDHAADQFQRCLSMDTNHVDAANYLAYMWAEQGTNLTQATTLIQQALAAEPDNPAFIDTRGWILFKQGNYKQALKDIERAYQLLDSDPAILEHLGDIWQQLDQPEKALRYWREALDMAPGQEELQQKINALENGRPPADGSH